MEYDVELGVLNKHESIEMARGLLSSRASEFDVETIAEEACGLPYFIQELVTNAVDNDAANPTLEARHDLKRLLLSRFHRLPDLSRRFLEVLATAGRPMTLGTVVRAVEPASTNQALFPLRAGRWIRTRGSGFDDAIETFHDTIRSAVLSSLPASVLIDHHRAIAKALEQSGVHDPEVLASHFQAAGVAARAAHYYSIAAHQAMAAGRPQPAASSRKSLCALSTTNWLKAWL